MSLGLARKKELQKRRHQKFWLCLKIIFFFSLFIGSSYFAFDTGQKITLRNIEYNQDTLAQKRKELDEIRLQLGNTEATLNRMQKLLPSTGVQDLLVIINQKLTNGISLKRMSTLITAMSKDGKCHDNPQTKRFIIKTPISLHKEGAVSFYKGLITVFGKGSPMLNENGNPESWFDPSKPVTTIFTLPGGEAQEAVGILPIHRSIIIKDKEYRFTIVNGHRSFANITVLSCAL